MRKKLKLICLVSIFLFAGKNLHAQSEVEERVRMGLGFGLDYGGLGAKMEFLPIKHWGIFGGLGYNFLSVGWNVGTTIKMLPDKKISPNLMAFYGYNGVIKIEGASYGTVSYGVTLGANLDIAVSSKGHKISIGVFAPIRSNEFMDEYNDMKRSSFFNIKNELSPIAISIGFNYPY